MCLLEFIFVKNETKPKFHFLRVMSSIKALNALSSGQVPANPFDDKTRKPQDNVTYPEDQGPL